MASVCQPDAQLPWKLVIMRTLALPAVNGYSAMTIVQPFSYTGYSSKGGVRHGEL